MNSEWLEALSRLSDGEPADADVLADALESGEMRQLLVDYTRMRGVIREAGGNPSAAFYTRMHAVLQPRRLQAPAWLTPFRIAAALALAVVLMGLGLESWRHSREDAPPRPVRVLRFDPSDWTAVGMGGS